MILVTNRKLSWNTLENDSIYQNSVWFWLKSEFVTNVAIFKKMALMTGTIRESNDTSLWLIPREQLDWYIKKNF